MSTRWSDKGRLYIEINLRWDFRSRRRRFMHYNCLIVDDEKELAQATCEYFTMFHTSCAWVASAAECERFLWENTIDALILIASFFSLHNNTPMVGFSSSVFSYLS